MTEDVERNMDVSLCLQLDRKSFFCHVDFRGMLLKKICVQFIHTVLIILMSLILRNVVGYFTSYLSIVFYLLIMLFVLKWKSLSVMPAWFTN